MIYKNIISFFMENIIEITYQDLVNFRNNHELIPCQNYRIIDYVTTTTQEDTISENHQFDIIVRAADESHLYEVARVCASRNSDYFNDLKLGTWRIWYSLDNDKSMYKWADPEKGKGVIYRMIDEFNNECYYDFVNIKFKRSKEWFQERPNWCKFVLGSVPTEDMYFYTFSWVTKDGDVKDLSIIGHSMKNEEGGVTGVHDNHISPCDDPLTKTIYKLGDNIFISTEYWHDKYFYGLYGNTLRPNCQHNTFGNECQYNILYNNCYDNLFGNHCQSNKLMTGCNNNIFKSSSYSNILGCGCEKISLNDSTYNTFGSECSNIVACASMHCNTFGSYCQHINCGNKSFGTARSFKFNIFENNVRYVNIYASKAFSSGFLQNVTICQGVKGVKGENLDVVIPVVNQDYQIKVAKNSFGDLKIYCEADLIK